MRLQAGRSLPAVKFWKLVSLFNLCWISLVLLGFLGGIVRTAATHTGQL